MSKSRRRGKPKILRVKDFVKESLEKGIASPSEMREIYNEKYPKKVRTLLSDASILLCQYRSKFQKFNI